MRNAVLAAAMMAATIGTAAHAQPGAPSAAPMQPGGWGASGWQAGGAYAPMSPTMPMTAAPAGYDPARAPAMAYPGYPAPVQRDYRPIRVGKKLPGGYSDPIYTVADWRAYGLEQPYPGTRWIRYFDDAVLADAHGRAIIVHPVAWNARPPMSRLAPMPSRGQWAPPVASKRTVRTGPNTVVTTEVIPPPRSYYGGGYGPDYGWGPGVTVTPSVVTTTVTTTTVPARRATRSRHRTHRR